MSRARSACACLLPARSTARPCSSSPATLQVRLSQDAPLDRVASAAPSAGRTCSRWTAGRWLRRSCLVAPDAGLYHLEVRSLSGAAAPRGYRLAVEARRPATTEDRSRAARLRDLAAADRQLLLGTAEGLAAALTAYQRLLAADSSPLLQDRIGQAQLRLGRGREALATSTPGSRSPASASTGASKPTCSTSPAAPTGSSAGARKRPPPSPRRSRSGASWAMPRWRLRPSTTWACSRRAPGRLPRRSPPTGARWSFYPAGGQPPFAAAVLNHLGEVYDLLGQLVEAVDHYEQELPLAREQGRRALEGEVLNNLAAAHGRLGRPREAVERYSEALEIFRERGDARLRPRRSTTSAICCLSWARRSRRASCCSRPCRCNGPPVPGAARRRPWPISAAPPATSGTSTAPWSCTARPWRSSAGAATRRRRRRLSPASRCSISPGEIRPAPSPPPAGRSISSGEQGTGPGRLSPCGLWTKRGSAAARPPGPRPPSAKPWPWRKRSGS